MENAGNESPKKQRNARKYTKRVKGGRNLVSCCELTQAHMNCKVTLLISNRLASRNYKLAFEEQVLVHAQRPDATAVLEIEK